MISGASLLTLSFQQYINRAERFAILKYCLCVDGGKKGIPLPMPPVTRCVLCACALLVTMRWSLIHTLVSLCVTMKMNSVKTKAN